MRRLGIIAALAAAAASCSPAPNLLPVNDLNRPTDVAFMCFGAFPGAGAADGGTSGLQVSGRPMRSCHPPLAYDPPPSTTSRTFAFIPDSASGGLTMVDADNWKLVDPESATGGYGQLPLGQLPEQISVSDDGCRLISANRGSCDLTLVDPSVLAAQVINLQDDPNAVVPPPRSAPANIRPLRGDGSRLVAAPYEAVFLPQDTKGLDGAALLCGGPGALAQAGPAGWATPAAPPVPWYALVTYPSCDLIVLIELPSGKIVRSVRVEKTTDGKSVQLVDAGTSPVCQSTDCAGQSIAYLDAGPTANVDAGADAGRPSTVDGGGSPTVDAGAPAGGAFPGIQQPDVAYFGVGPLSPTSIAIVPDGSRAYVSLANASFIASIGLSQSGLVLPGNAIYLHEGARGSKRIRLNVDPYAYVGDLATPPTGPLYSGKFVGADTDGRREYLYAIAQDGTLRVVSISNRGAEEECETNADPLNLAPGTTASTPCIPIDPVDPARHRRPFSVGPGIHFPAVPIDVAAADIRVAPLPDTSEQSVNGAHAWVMTSSGIVYLVNIDPVLRQYYAPDPNNNYVTPAPPTPGNAVEQTPFENTLRDRNEITYSLTLDPSSGPPRVDVLPSVAATGPYIEPFWTQGAIHNATALTGDYVETDVFFTQEPNPTSMFDVIDRRAVTPQSWSVTWEGALIGTRNTGRVQPENLGALPANGSSAGPRGSLFQDGGGNYCGAGVLPGDLLTLSGCTNNAQCGLGEGCLIDTTVTTAAGGVPVTGLCVDPNLVDAQSTACAPFLDSVRRYEIVAAYPSQLVIRPHLDELVRSGLTPCHPADPDNPVANDCPDPNDPTTNKFTCQTIYPAVGSGPRCLMKGCTSDNDCRVGRNCVDFDAPETSPPSPACGDGHCFCADAPPIDRNGSRCFDQLVAYQVNVGNGFLVAGSQSGFITTASPLADGSCSLDPTPDPRFIFRIPMNAPQCTNTPSGPTGPDASLMGAAVNAIDSRIDPGNVPLTVSHPDPSAPNDPTKKITDNTRARAINNANLLVKIVETAPAPDPCLYFGGPVGTEPVIDPTLDPELVMPPPAPQHVRALFRNSQMSFVLANVDRQPTGQFQTGFDVHGGFVAQVVQDPVTVEISMPARIVLGPVDSQVQLTGSANPTGAAPKYEVPYIFVVDERRLGRGQGGGPTRGQLLRIHPLGFASSVGLASGSQPIFQDYTTSGGLFPIQ